MKTYVAHDPQSLTGFSIVIENDDDTSTTRPITKIVEDGHTLVLPDNPTGRKYFSIIKAQSSNLVEITPRGTISSDGTYTPRATRISFTNEDLATLSPDTADIIRQAYASLSVQRERAKLKALIAKYEAQYEALKAQMEV